MMSSGLLLDKFEKVNVLVIIHPPIQKPDFILSLLFIESYARFYSLQSSYVLRFAAM